MSTNISISDTCFHISIVKPACQMLYLWDRGAFFYTLSTI